MVMGTEGKGWASGYLNDMQLILFCQEITHSYQSWNYLSKFLTLKNYMTMVPIHHENGHLEKDQISQSGKKNEFSQECVILKMPEGCQSRWAEVKWERENKNQERDLHRQTELS